MPTQPGYLRALKAHSRAQFGSDDDLDALHKDLTTETDRGAFILAASSIEDALETKLRMLMVGIAADTEAQNQIFGINGSAGTYSEKILLAYALGSIDKRARKDIDLVREIRNACAHSRRRLTLETKALADTVKAALGTEALRRLKNHDPRTLRLAFISHCAILGHYVMTKKRLTLFDAILP